MSELPKLYKLIRKSEKIRFLRKESIKYTEDNYLYLINQGLIILKQGTLGGYTIIHKILNDNTFFIGNKNKYMYSKSDSSYFKFNLKHINTDKVLLYEYNSFLELENEKKDMLIRDILVKDKTCSLVSIILRLANTFGVKEENKIKIPIKITQEELGQYCGTTRENIARSIKILKESKCISYSKSSITIIDIEFMKSMIDCENCKSEICSTR